MNILILCIIPDNFCRADQNNINNSKGQPQRLPLHLNFKYANHLNIEIKFHKYDDISIEILKI